MKKIIIILACIACFWGCGKGADIGASIITLDSCQYAVMNFAAGVAITHHANCKYCRERNAKYIITDGDGVPATGIGGWDNPTLMTKINGSNFTGTPVYTLAVDNLGNIIETPIGKIKLNRY